MRRKIQLVEVKRDFSAENAIQILDIIQDLPDSVWYSLPSKIRIYKNFEELAADSADTA